LRGTGAATPAHDQAHQLKDSEQSTHTNDGSKHVKGPEVMRCGIAAGHDDQVDHDAEDDEEWDTHEPALRCGWHKEPAPLIMDMHHCHG
jgi:hypothetical protein